MRKPEFIIFAPSFDENVGGRIVLHTLCARLNELGYPAALWPMSKPPTRRCWQWPTLRRHLGYLARRDEKHFSTGPFPRRIARYRDLAGATVVYPEMVAGNPLGSARVARWFLHRPGFHTGGRVDYGPGEIYFFYEPGFNDPAINPHPDHHLQLTYLNPAYRQTNFGPREGTCYVVRKGALRPSLKIDRHPSDAVCVDEMSHEERAAVFNKCTALYSYDMYTFYSTYAALCGCVPIVVPDEEVTAQQWVPDPERRYGLAYGEDQVGWAIRTRPDLLERIRRTRELEDDYVHDFVAKCRRHFGSADA
ncbi:hypothetical protein E2493_01185 [Sphingomonas parva]|uniref:WavQ n=1 Tax=Sphingomonas parva TaxID=2555898 RepID=A0A4Y8ZVF6_9SPHN|nr:hypothetical protein [Sphingomonas parva]TFI59894.1 hypothetical protein E2493_01185 [Sphingomonas parva]